MLEEETQPPLSPQPRPPQYSVYSVYAFIVCAVLSQNAFGWQIVYGSSTIIPFLLALFVTAFALAIYVICMLEICGLYPFSGGSYALMRVTLGNFPAFVVGCLDVLQYAFMAFFAIIMSSNNIRVVLGLDLVYTGCFTAVIYILLGITLAFTWRKSSLPSIFIGCAGFLFVLYLLFVLITIPQMDSERWMHNYDKEEQEDELSFGVQFISSVAYTLPLTRGFPAAFLLCDKVAEVGYAECPLGSLVVTPSHHFSPLLICTPLLTTSQPFSPNLIFTPLIPPSHHFSPLLATSHYFSSAVLLLFTHLHTTHNTQHTTHNTYHTAVGNNPQSRGLALRNSLPVDPCASGLRGVAIPGHYS